MSNKLPFEYVDREVDKLYEKEFDTSEVDAINKHCEFIADFIRACGWTEEEFQDVKYKVGERYLNPKLN